jgi:hypothetical protein
MSQKRREQRRHKHAESEGQIRWAAVLRSIVLAGGMALVVVSVLVPSEAAVSDGAYAPLAAGWCLLLVVWAASLWLDERPTLVLGWTEAIGAALIGWHSLAAVVSLGHTNGRQALNAHWLILGYGLTVFLLRQSLRTQQQARSLALAMIWLATLLAGLGLYQYGYGMPRLRRNFEQNSAQVLAATGIPAEPGSAQRELLENRIQSVEPLATFALTNSLAGFLAPWLVALLAIGLANFRDREQRPALLALASGGLLIAACLVLTKSRTAYLATLAGVVLAGLYGRRGGWRLDWRIPAALALVLAAIGLVAIYSGGLDVQVLSEAPKSVLYRLEYWQATARMIAEHPTFGCGPGNFQEAYAAYKLPQASEMVADPHNFLLEMWATAGTPAVVLLLALLAAFAFDVAAQARLPATSEPPSDDAAVAPARSIVFGGALAGLLLAPLIAAAMDHPLEPLTPTFVVWVLGGALLAAAWWGFAPWIERGELTLTAAIVPQIVLLINLLAAGAIAFPGVMATILVLAPVALLVARQSHAGVVAASSVSLLPPSLSPSRFVAGLIALAAAALAVACLYTEYYPVLNGRMALSDAVERLSRGKFVEAEAQATAAAKADALSPEPWRILAELRLSRWQATGSDKDWQAFVAAANTFTQLDPRHHQAWQSRGIWFLTAWRKSQRKEDLSEAVSAFTRASMCYPNGAFYHAQLAWALHLAGQHDAARQAAERALELDGQMPHKEKKLDRQHVADPQIAGGEIKLFRDESAEQTAQSLRKP